MRSAPPLACTVRGCGLLLERHGRTYRCARGHSYDVARSGYLNLLQPQDRRSLHAGDSADAIAARARLLAAGVGRDVISAIAMRLGATLSPADVVIDLGAGSGELLAAVRAQAPAAIAVGIDLSTAAAEYAAKHHPEITWVVANADRRLPLLDRSVDVVVSVHGRRNPEECARVLARAGVLVIAVPAADDLAELRAEVQGEAVARDRRTALLEEHAPWFASVDQFESREVHDLEGEALRDLLRGTYRGGRRSAHASIAALERLRVTVASKVFVLRQR